MPDPISSGAVFSFIGSLAPNASIVAVVNLGPIPEAAHAKRQTNYYGNPPRPELVGIVSRYIINPRTAR